MAQKIEIVRGTTETIQIDITDANNAPYVIVNGETVIFGIKRKPTDDELIFVRGAKIGDVGSYLVEIFPEDTDNLPCDKYFYDVALQSGKNFYNIIEASPLVILPNITRRGCIE